MLVLYIISKKKDVIYNNILSPEEVISIADHYWEEEINISFCMSVQDTNIPCGKFNI